MKLKNNLNKIISKASQSNNIYIYIYIYIN